MDKYNGRILDDLNYDSIEPLPFTHKNMVDLLCVYRACTWIERFFLTVTNIIPDTKLLRDLQHVDNLLCDLSPLFDKDKDYEGQCFSRILDDTNLSIDKKAALLMDLSLTDSN